MNRIKPTAFERNPKTTFVCLFFVFFLLCFGIVEYTLKNIVGLGNPALFISHPDFGYRLKSNQETTRFWGTYFNINNLGLRANDDWNKQVNNKIIFLGDSITYGGNRISNQELFSEVAVKKYKNFKAGNAGVPNWGVENVYALIVKNEFLPACIYITTFIEDDFYRGLAKSENKPWIKYEKPYLATQEFLEFVWYKYIRNPKKINKEKLKKIPPKQRLENAVRKLAYMDNYLKSKGFQHAIYISPTRAQVLRGIEKNQDIETLLKEYNISVIYILDSEAVQKAKPEEKKKWFQDIHHLSKYGHIVWGNLMAKKIKTILGKCS